MASNPRLPGLGITPSEEILKDIPVEEGEDPFAEHQSKTIYDREDEYKRQRFDRTLTPARQDPFAAPGTGPKDARSYKEVMREADITRKEAELRQKIEEKMKEEKEAAERKQREAQRVIDDAQRDASGVSSSAAAVPASGRKRRRRWDSTGEEGAEAAPAAAAAASSSRWDMPTPRGDAAGASSSSWDAPTPKMGDGGGGGGGTTTTPRKRSRWDETPVSVAPGGYGATPLGAGSAGMFAATPAMGAAVANTQQLEAAFKELSDEDLDALLPKQGYKILEKPDSYQPIRTPARKLLATPTPMAGSGFFQIPEAQPKEVYDLPPVPEGLNLNKASDYDAFRKLLDGKDDDDFDLEEANERKILRLLLKVKNGPPPDRKKSLRTLSDRALEFGPGPIFGQLLPLMMAQDLEDQERHLLVKVINRVLFKLDELVRPYVHKILVVIEPLLIDEDYYARVEAREVISNLAKAAGLATMIATMRPDIDNPDEYVRNTTARAFSVVSGSLGIPAMLPFLDAVCRSRKSWQGRHTGVKIIQQVAILMGCGVLPHLPPLVRIVSARLDDAEPKVRTISALAIAALAEAAHPYGIESFDVVLKPLWLGIKQHRGKALAAFLKAVGFIIPLMDAEYASKYAKEVTPVLIREFQTPDEEMKKIILKVVKQICATEGVDIEYIKKEILPDFFRHFWIRRMALDRRNYVQLIDTTVELANKVGAAEIVSRVVDGLKDESEPYRRMVMEGIDKTIYNLGSSEIDKKLEEQLVDGALYAFQEQLTDDSTTMMDGFGTVVNALGLRVKPYLPQIAGTIKWRLNNRTPIVRQQASDLITRIAVVMMKCDQEAMLNHLGVVLYESLGEEYPDVLGSSLGALKAIVNVVGMERITPPVKDLLPSLTPILKNRHEKVQENCIDLVGRIADRGAEYVSPREWMRICFELLEMLKAHKKGIRRAAVNTFGYIAKAIGPHDVLATLLSNLKVQERQLRVCTTVAIAIVAETCAPFTVLPALMNEYRVPDLNVQNGVLKALSFMFEYISEMAKDYVHAVTPLLEDALSDRDVVHRQIACNVVKHISMGVVGLGCEDAILHLMNFVFPNIFEVSPHVHNAVMEAVEGGRLVVGPQKMLQYVLQGLFHPARKVRTVYWKIFNMLYVTGQDSLVPSYPRIPSEGTTTYERPELDMFI